LGIIEQKLYRDLLQRLILIIICTWEAEFRRVLVSGQPGQKFHETQSHPTAVHSGVHMHLTYGKNPKNGGPWFRLAWIENMILSPKQQKRARGVAYVIECLPIKHKTNSSNTSIIKIK
jgi:hypothetical protein